MSSLGRALVLLALVNFMAFWFLTMALGGDALNGRVANGRYFVAAHGKYSEVTGAQFRFSAWHSRSVLLTHLLGVLGVVLLYSIGDPFLTQRKRNRKRDVWLLGVMCTSLAVRVLGGNTLTWVPLTVFPLAILIGVLLDLRDANRAQLPVRSTDLTGKHQRTPT